MNEQSVPTGSVSGTPRLGWRIGAAAASRLFLNTARRFAYPFAPELSRGMGIPLTAVTSMIAANQLTGIFSLVFGPMGDRWGYRSLLLAGLGMLGAGMLVGGFFPFYPIILAALFFAGLGKSVFDPAIQAYVGKVVPFQRRGTVIGIIEMSWAGSSLVGIPLIGLLMNRFGWRAPFFALGGLALLSAGALALLIPGKNPGEPATSDTPIHFWSSWRCLAQERAALGAIGFAFFISVANDNFFVVYGAWLEEAFGLGIVALGMATTVIGGAELLGEFLTASLADRVGLKRSAGIGLALSGVSYALLPILGQTLPSALIGLFVVFFTVEFTIVTCISLFTEVLPEARATMMSAFLAASGIGRVFGALVGGSVWMAGGITAIGFFSAFISGLALISLVWGLRGWRPLGGDFTGALKSE